jgi:hypothetical protein
MSEQFHLAAGGQMLLAAHTQSRGLDNSSESCPHGSEAWIPLPDLDEAIFCLGCHVDWLPFPARVGASEDASWHILEGGKSTNTKA